MKGRDRGIYRVGENDRVTKVMDRERGKGSEMEREEEDMKKRRVIRKGVNEGAL